MRAKTCKHANYEVQKQRNLKHTKQIEILHFEPAEINLFPMRSAKMIERRRKTQNPKKFLTPPVACYPKQL